MTNLYLDGVGVRERTRQLTNEMFSRLPIAIGGTWIGLMGAGGALMSAFNSAPKYYASDPRFIFTFWHYCGFGICALVVIVPAIWFERSVATLNRHTRAIDEETARHGGGWANS